MCCLDAGLDHKDQQDQVAPDVLVVVDPRNPEPYITFLNFQLHAAYTAVVFTRNPALTLPGQRHALLAVALVRSITQLCEPAHQTAQHVLATLHILFTLRSYLGSNRPNVSAKACTCGIVRAVERHEASHGFDRRCIGQLMEPHPGQNLTEADDDVQSICRVLAALCCLPELCITAGVFKTENTGQLQEACRALLAEAVSRDVRVQVRSKLAEGQLEKDVSMALLGKALGISEDSCVLPQPDGVPEPKDVWFSSAFDRDTAKVNVASRRSCRGGCMM